MSDTTAPPTDVEVLAERRTVDGTGIVRLASFGLLIAGLFLAALYLGSGPTSFTRPATLIADLYATGDHEGIYDRLAPGSVPIGQEEAFRNGLAQEVASGSEVAGSNELTFDGRRFTQTLMTSGLEYCVAPNGDIYILCRMGGATGEQAGDEAPVDVAVATADVFAGATRLSVILVGAGTDAYTFEGSLEVAGPDGEAIDGGIVGLNYVSGGQTFPAEEGALELPPGIGLLVSIEAADHTTLTGRDLELAWGNGSLTLAMGPADLLTR